MSRPIKFRAWDTKKKEWYGASHPDILTFYGFALFGECTMMCMPPVEHLQYLEVTQFTGLTDKNGKEIYEGDIVLVNRGQTTNMGYPNAPHNSLEFKSVIEWQDNNACFNINNPESAESEVIGNIYENPELLK